MTTATDHLVKVMAPLEEEAPAGQEGLWARELGDGLYELRSVPWFPFGLNYGDVVRCREGEWERVIEEVVTPSGHRTLRLFFNTTVVSPDQQAEILDRLRALGAEGERAGSFLISLDVEPDADYDQLWAYLEPLEEENKLFVEEAWRGLIEAWGDREPPIWLEG